MVAGGAGTAVAQGGDPSLLRNKAVQREMKVGKEQAEKLDAFLAEVNAKQDEGEAAFRTATPQERRKLMEDMKAYVLKGLNDVLKPEQFKRFEQIEMQRAGLGLFGIPQIQDRLGLAEDQKAKVSAIVAEARNANRTVDIEAKDAASAEKKHTEIKDKATGQIFAVMTPAQQAAWKDMIGPPFVVPREAPRRPMPAKKARL